LKRQIAGYNNCAVYLDLQSLPDLVHPLNTTMGRPGVMVLRACAGACKKRVLRGTKVSAIHTIAKSIFVYLMLFARQKRSANYSIMPSRSQPPCTYFSDFPAFSIEIYVVDDACFNYFKRSNLVTVPLIEGLCSLDSFKFSVLRAHLLLCFFGRKKC